MFFRRSRPAQPFRRRATRSRLFFEALEDRRVLATVDALDDLGSTNEDTPTIINVRQNDTSSSGSPITVTSVAQPLNGTTSLNSDGTVTYTPAPNFFGTDIFSYTVTDGSVSPVPVTAGRSTLDYFAYANSTIQQSTLDSDYFTNMQQGGIDRLRGSVSAVSSASGRVEMSGFGEATWESASQGQVFFSNITWTRQSSYQGSASLVDGSGWTYQFTPSQSGTFVLDHNIQVTNSFGSQELGEFRLGWSTGGGSTFQLINADHRANVLGTTSFPVQAGAAYTVSVQPNFALAWGGQFPVTDYEGMNALFSFRVVSGAASDSAMVTVTVNPVNDPPVANNDSAETDEGTAVTIPVLGNDVDVDGDGLWTITGAGPADNGVVEIGPNGTVIYTPNPGFEGIDSFAYVVDDDDGGSDLGVVTVTVAAVNNSPVANPLTVSTSEDASVTGQVTASDDEAVVGFIRIAGPYNGQVLFNEADGRFTYYPNPNFFGSDSFQFIASDGASYSEPATVSINVSPVNDAPVAHLWQFGTNEDTPLVETFRASDIDGDPLTYSIVESPRFGTVQPAAGAVGGFIYTPNPNYADTDSFTFRVFDGTAYSAPARIFVTVRPVNDPPTTQSQQIQTDEDTPVNGQLIASDVDNSSLTYSVVTQPSHGTLQYAANTGAFTYIPSSNYSGPDSFTFRASDGRLNSAVSAVSISVTAVNDAPTASNQAASGSEDNVIPIILVASDVEGSPLTYTIVSGPTNGTLSPSPTAPSAFTYRPNANYFGPDSFTFTASDGQATSAPATFSLLIASVNDPPVSQSQAIDVDEDGSVTGQLSGSDIDSSSLTYVLVSEPTKGTVSLNAQTGAFTYTPHANANGSDPFTFKVNDGQLDSPPYTVSINIRPVNDAPIALAQFASTPEDQAISGIVAATDIDSATLTFALVSGPSHGTLAFNSATGAYIYTPTGNYSGPDAFIFQASDGAASSNQAIVTLEVTPVNDRPTATDAVFQLPESASVGTVVGTVPASDIDDAILSFALSGADSAAFSIDASGQIRVRDAALIDFELQKTHSFTAIVTDSSGGQGKANITVNLINTAELAIDIAPGDSTNRIDLGSSTISVAILATSTFDPLTVDLGSLRLSSPTSTTSATVSSHPKQGYKYERRDVNGDGRLDLVLAFSTSATGLKEGDTKLQLSGRMQVSGGFESFLIEQAVEVVVPRKGNGRK